VKYVAFLRGINVGKHRRITMAELKAAFEAAGYSNVATYVASGNVIFDSGSADSSALTAEVETKLERALGYHVYVIVRGADEIRWLVATNPFNGLERTDQIRLNVTFLDGGGAAPAGSPEVPGFRILGVSDRTVFSVLDLREIGTRDVMTVLEKTYGKRITTRTWKVIQEINSQYLQREL
jgi:uncharacterized protein (DUF1697 family)